MPELINNRTCNEIATCIAMMANRAGVDSIDLYRSIKRHLKISRWAEHEVGILLLERWNAGEKDFAIRTGEIAAMLNEGPGVTKGGPRTPVPLAPRPRSLK